MIAWKKRLPSTLHQPVVIILLWTVIKAINVIQSHYWLQSNGINRSVMQIIQAQGTIWLVGVAAILSIHYCLVQYPWFSRWDVKALLANLAILLCFAVLVPVGPSLVYLLWSGMPVSLNAFADVYMNGTAEIFKNVALYYVLILSLSYGLHFYAEKRSSEVRAARLREDLIQAKLDLLHSQLQPHFLFNTLHNISALMEENVKDAQNILVSLSDLLRKSLEVQDAKFIPLSEELKVLDLYLSIQLIRFSDSLEIHKDIDKDTISQNVLPFILQPLVENSFKHGMTGHLTIGIRTFSARGYLHIVIQDNGPGFRKLEEGRGINNVRNRLRAVYEDFELDITSGETGVTNELKIPIKNR